jgi:hydrophobic/amphiphilic exporter-1 (mainly G- bacteria), HAE1 family
MEQETATGNQGSSSGFEESGSSRVAGALTRFSLRRRITVLVLFLTVVVVGCIATIGIPLELFPRGFQMPALFIQVPWPNAPAEEVMEKITIPLEDELSTVRGLEGMNSWSSSFGCNVYLRFKRGTDMSIAYREVRDRMQRARIVFPDDVDRTFIHKRDASSIPVAVIGMVMDPELTDFYHLIQTEVIAPLSRLDGVATVRADGLEEKEILIELDRKRTESHGLDIYALAQEMRNDNFTMASGQVHEAGRKLLLRSMGQYASVEELENRPITATIRLKHVARVRYEEAEKNYSVRVNGRPAVAVVLHKEGEANIVDVSRRIKESVEGMRSNPRLGSVYMEMLFNQGDVVEGAVSNLAASGRLGGIFAALVLFVFLRRVRLTGIVTLSIPVSILIALVAIYFLGETLNILTLLALVMCVGLLVDNSVVVAENIHRLHREGLPRGAACVTGAGEIALAITTATLTTVVVFLPTALVEGEGQFFLMRLALPISASLIASLFVALVFIPVSVYLTLPQKSQGNSGSSHQRINAILRGFYEVSFGRLNRFYVRALAFFLGHRFELVLILVLLGGLTKFVAVKKVSIVDAQEEDRTSFHIGVESPREYNFQDLAE